MAEEEGSGSKPPRFNGKQEQYQIFNTRFKAFAKMKEFGQAVDCKGVDPDLPTAAVNATGTAYTKEEKLAIRRNDKAMYNYTLAFQTEACMGMIYGASTTEWPDGLAWLVAKALNKKYAPKDRISRVEMKRQLTAVSMSKKKDPYNSLRSSTGSPICSMMAT